MQAIVTVTKAGKTVYLDPLVITVPAPVQVTTTTSPDGKTTTTTTIVGADGSRRQMTVTRGGSIRPARARGKPLAAFKVGDRVLVEWAGKTETAVVAEVLSNGWVKAKFPRNGIELTPGASRRIGSSRRRSRHPARPCGPGRARGTSSRSRRNSWN